MQTPRPALSGPGHVFLHGVVVVLGWIMFGWGWWTVGFVHTLRPTVLPALIVLTLIIVPLLTLFWVVHNREIYARKGQRTGLRASVETYTQDWSGRQVHAEFEALRHAALVMINSTPTDKYFLSGDEAARTKSDLYALCA